VADLLIAVLVLTGCVYGTSAAAKLGGRRAYRSYRAGLGEAGLVPARLLPATAAALAAGETAAAAGLAAAAVLTAVAGPGAVTVTAVSLSGAALLTAILAAGVAVVVHRGTRARCACFGAASGGSAGRPLGRAHLLRNLGLLAVVAAGLAADAVTAGRPAPAGAVLAALAGAVAAVLLVRLDDLVAVFTPVSRGSAG
jgi:hypothetical protein